MNYRHIFHAGGFSDVHKHAILSILLEAYVLKNKPFYYIDTHAGIGEYDYSREEVARNPEYLEGVSRFLETKDPDLLALPYYPIVQRYQTPTGLRGYPGSPVIAENLIRDYGILVLNEKHPEDVLTLKQEFKGHPAIHIHHRDAYEFLPAILPPDPRRAVILIDPPYESKTEFKDLPALLEKSIKRFPQGCYAIWYPIKDHQSAEFISEITRFLAEKPLVSEIVVKHPTESSGILGSGLVIVNPPWKSEERIQLVTIKLEKLFTR